MSNIQRKKMWSERKWPFGDGSNGVWPFYVVVLLVVGSFSMGKFDLICYPSFGDHAKKTFKKGLVHVTYCQDRKTIKGVVCLAMSSTIFKKK